MITILTTSYTGAPWYFAYSCLCCCHLQLKKSKSRWYFPVCLPWSGSEKPLSLSRSSCWGAICKSLDGDHAHDRFQPPRSESQLTSSQSSFFQSVCIIGYTLFPLVLAAMCSALHMPGVARIPVYLVLVGWSTAAGVSILGGSGVVKNRVGLAVYPLLVFYVGLGCLCFIS